MHFLTTYCLSKKVMASQKLRLRIFVPERDKSETLLKWFLRQRPLNARVDWKRSVISTVSLCNYICKWLDIQVFSDKDYEP